jgi:hypothetical protein
MQLDIIEALSHFFIVLYVLYKLKKQKKANHKKNEWAFGWVQGWLRHAFSGSALYISIRYILGNLIHDYPTIFIFWFIYKYPHFYMK